MKPIEYQLFKEILDKTWTKSINTVVQTWTIRNCALIAKDIKKVTNILVHEKSILRFSQILENEDITRNKTKYILAMYLNEKEGVNNMWDRISWDTMLENISVTTTQKTLTKYEIYYKSKLSTNIQSDSFLEINNNNFCKLTHRNKNKTREWQGYAKIKNGNLFITFENEDEIIYMIVKSVPNNDYLTAMLLAIDDNNHSPNCPILLLVRENMKEADKQDRIKLFFKQRKDSYRLSINDELIIIASNGNYDFEQVVTYLNTKIGSIVGNWVIYTCHEKDHIYYKSRMAIKGVHDVIYEGLRQSYTGNVVIKNQDVYIYLNGEKNALLCFSLNYLKSNKIQKIKGAYVTISSGDGCSTFGNAMLIRSKVEFKKLERRKILKNTEEYKELEKEKFLNELVIYRF